MIGQGKLINLCSCLGSYRNLFVNRVIVCVYQQQNAGLRSKTKETLKNLKIPEEPKKPLTPYFRFLLYKREEVKKQNPELSVTEIAKRCSEEWAKINPNVKEKYSQDFDDEMIIYKQKAELYKGSLTKEQVEALAQARKEKKEDKKQRALKKIYKETNKPKRPITSFLYYIQEKRALPENEKLTYSEVIKNCSNEWKSMSDEQKLKYVNFSTEAKKKYEKEIAAWEARMIKEGNVDIVRKESQIASSVKPLKIHSNEPEDENKVATKPSKQKKASTKASPTEKKTR